MGPTVEHFHPKDVYRKRRLSNACTGRSQAPYHSPQSPLSCGFLDFCNFLLARLTFCLLKSGLPVECVSRSRTYLLIGKLTTSVKLSIPDGKKERRAMCSPTHHTGQPLHGHGPFCSSPSNENFMLGQLAS